MGLLEEYQMQYYNGNNFGGYQFTSLDDIINQFMVVYVGEDKIIPKARRLDVAFHAQRAMQELSFDVFKSCKSQEITVPPSLQMILPQDYVNYTKVSWVDSAGIKHPMYPTNRTSNPKNPYQNSDGDLRYDVSATITSGSTGIVLDDVYNNITIGAFVTGPSIGIWTVKQNELDSSTGNTRLQLVNNFTALTYYTPTTSFTETLTIIQAPFDGNITPTLKEDVITPAISSSPWTAGNRTITFDNASDTDGIEIGMFINYHPSFPVGTTVTGINGKHVTVSSTATTSPTSVSSILFTSKELADSDTWSKYKSSTPSENQDSYDDDYYINNLGQRYGLNPQHAQVNGSFYIDCVSGKIHFSSNINGKIVVLDYISDTLGTDEEMKVHKFAEEAMYKWITHAVLASKANTPEYIVSRLKKERFAAIRNAKLRLSNIKLEEITQVLRGKSKQIKH